VTDRIPTLEQIDVDGAISEALAAVHGDTRAGFLRKAALGGGVLLGALAAPPSAGAASARTDTRLLNFDLVFEYLQASYYTEAERLGTVAAMSPPRRRWARTLGAHEIAHVKIIKSVLGSAAVRKPTFNFHGVTDSESEFVKTAVAMEDLTVALLNGQVGRIHDNGLRAALYGLITVEARHAAWARRLVGTQPVAGSFDQAKPTSEVGRIVARTHFVASRPRTSSRGRPRFTG
jgi:hypothetical protein